MTNLMVNESYQAKDVVEEQVMSGLKEGRKAPPFTIQNEQGAKIKLADVEFFLILGSIVGNSGPNLKSTTTPDFNWANSVAPLFQHNHFYFAQC